MHLTDTLLAIIVATLLLSGMAEVATEWRQTADARTAAQEVRDIASAAQGYMDAHEAALTAACTRSSGLTLDAAAMAARGILPPGMPAASPWGQSWTVAFRLLDDAASEDAGDGASSPDGAASAEASSQADSSRAERSPRLVAFVLATGLPAPAGTSANAAEELTRRRSLRAARALDGAGYWVPGTGVRTISGAEESFLTATGPNPRRIRPEDFGIVCPAGTFGTVVGLTRTAGASLGDWLSRTAVEGSPELNAMQTDLNMDGNAIHAATSLSLVPIGEGRWSVDGGPVGTVAELERLCREEDSLDGAIFLDADRGVFICRRNAGATQGVLAQMLDTENAVAIRHAGIHDNGETIPMPVCPANQTPHIFVTPASTAQGAEADPMRAYQTWAEVLPAEGGRNWRIRHRILAGGTWMEPEEGYASLLVLTTCGEGGRP